MNGPIILNNAREQLAVEIFTYCEPKPAPLKISPWLAMTREGFRKIGEPLCPFVALLTPLASIEASILQDDDIQLRSWSGRF